MATRSDSANAITHSRCSSVSGTRTPRAASIGAHASSARPDLAACLFEADIVAEPDHRFAPGKRVKFDGIDQASWRAAYYSA
jgi:hypothetical protein